MATPVSIESLPRGHVRTESEQDRDLQAKVQRMISIQYHEQNISNSNSNLTTGDGADGDERAIGNDWKYDTSKTSNGNGSGDGVRGLTLTKRQNTQTHTDLLGLGNANDSDSNDNAKTLHPSSGDVSNDVLHSKEHPEVGKGTIVFSGTLRGSKYATSSGVDDDGDNLEENTLPRQGDTNQQQYLQQDAPRQYQQNMSPHSTTLGSQQQRLLSSQLPQQIYSGYGSVQEQNHEFHYGNPDYNNIDDQDYYYDEHQGYRRGENNRTCCTRFLARLYSPIAYLVEQENLRRSFCYGAIDGLLTGSGIASAFWGLGLLSVRTQIELRIAFVAFTVAACVADALCMAMGHMWTTYIVTSNHAWERSHERELLELNKADSKGRLVDMLLDRGMLKIDAMSLADTLEGYPDLFVSALVGDSLLSSGIQDALLDERTDDGYQHQEQGSMYSDPATDFDGGGAFFGSFGSWNLPLHYDSDRGVHRNVEEGHVQVVYHESQKEGFFMMMGFSSFAVVPSLLWLFLPHWFNIQASIRSKRQLPSSPSYAGLDDGESVNIPSLIILILSGVVWCLGVWKSRFVDSNWIVFGLETIAVLLVCISSAYGIAALLVHVLGLYDFLILQEGNIHTSAPSSANSVDL
mmetsp:Transcript_870/g.2008  ORF Transcript_870/g.2008 Transcript_870/m.2008 type:complete len:631 (-) Transcript_870:1243-3135(-)|eukprot:CAMPEP_0168167274 /NCGR_PEP_ID=MMETSP0139_2-20121125/2464_1 /TAXON_ID=44445 /ORGANISM="Pseudo-nitzschia australis, Strain 10249 10 AB" /LENGTH=630 /DNA_ID=CAMNT_0008084509 /DNA_START=113 /DNA_END=2005 /DNA_ORIENTATION=+